MNNYSEQIFQSIDTIISQRLNEVKFDRTITCEVIAGVKDYPNKYWVSDGATKFQTCVADSSRTYTEKQKVYVLIPNGDYNSADKVIIGSYTADELPKNLYTNPFDHLVYSSKVLFGPALDKYIETSADTENLISIGEQGIVFNYSNTTPFDYVGLDFSFNTTDLQGMKKGNYGIQFTLKNNDAEIFTSAIDSSQLYGNIYNFNSLMKMQHLFPIPTDVDITQANKLVVNLYQKGNFDISKKKIYLNEATFYFGYDVEKIDRNKLILHLDKTESLVFKDNEKRNFYLEWQDTDLNKIYTSSKNDAPAYKYEIYWCHYEVGYKKIKEDDIEETGVYWRTLIKNKDFKYQADLKKDNQREQFKVGIKYYDETEEIEKLKSQQKQELKAIDEDTTLIDKEEKKKAINEKYQAWFNNLQEYINNNNLWKYLESNVLIFTNEDVKPEPGSTNNSEDSIKLTCSDSGVYNYYMAQGPIVDYSYTREERTITASFLDGYDIEKDSKEVIWEIVGIKNDNETMIKFNTEKSTNKTLVFTIKDEYLSGRNDLNTILCTATLPNGEIRRGKITLHFGEISTAGSQYAFNLHFEDNKSCLHPINGDNLIVSATLQRRDGETILPLPDIEWSIEGNNKDKNNTAILSAAAGDNYSCTLTYMLSSGFPEMADNEYYSATLKAVIKDFTIDNGLTTDLTAYLPIPLGANNCNYISGITSVSYFTNGPSKMVSKKKYQIYGIDIPTGIKWLPDSFKVKIKEDNKEKEIEKPFLPYVNSKKTTLVVPTFPAWENNQETLYYGIVAKSNDTILWMQPIVLKQNGYDDDFVNSYSNTLTIDEGRNAIGVATLVVGRKEEGNKLTGIEMGELYQVDENGNKITYLESGLYGKQKNVNMFYLTNKGAFFVGDGNNYISFNDETKKTKNALMIKTSLFNLNSDNIIVNSNGLTINGGNFVVKNDNNDTLLNLDSDQKSLLFSGYLTNTTKTSRFYFSNSPVPGDGPGLFCEETQTAARQWLKIWPGYDAKKAYKNAVISGRYGLAISDYDDNTSIAKFTKVGIEINAPFSSKIQLKNGCNFYGNEHNQIWRDSLQRIHFSANSNLILDLWKSGSGNNSIYTTALDTSWWETSSGFQIGGQLHGYWVGKFSSSSDLRLKNSIKDLSSSLYYQNFFDNLKPKSFRYNKEDKNIHIGFIAQEVNQALKDNNLNVQDFAFSELAGRPGEEAYWTLRYSEFIALNTWQIQKLKQRVIELENEIKEIKQNENN